MGKRTNICVYCASGNNLRQEFFDTATELGTLLARKGMGCICGAGREGLMARIAEAAIAAGGSAIGVIPSFMAERGWCHPGLTETIVTDDIHSRKKLMVQMSDGIIALPGGCGTMEELLEIITWKQLGLYTKPIVVLNACGYYDPLIEMLNRAIAENFMKKSHSRLWHTASTAEEAVEILESLPSEEPEAESKYDN